MKEFSDISLDISPVMAHDFTDKQRQLCHSLKRHDPGLAKMYLGAIRILADEENPEHLVLAAHSIRELMEKLPRHLGIPTRAPGGELARSVSKLAGNWKQTKESSQNWSGTNWQGQIDPPLTEFLDELDIFFTKNASHSQSRSDETRTLLRRLELAPHHLPPNLEDRTLSIWRNLNRFFIDVSHHRKTTDRRVFDDNLKQFEIMLLDRLYPQTFDDFSEIDELIAVTPIEITPQLDELIGKRTANYQHFFSSVSSPDWLELLKNKGFFTTPPPPIISDGYISHPPWPESAYLARMAQVPQAQQIVLELTLAIPQTDNHNVRNDIINISLALPPSQAAQLVAKIQCWIEGSWWGLPTQIAKCYLSN